MSPDEKLDKWLADIKARGGPKPLSKEETLKRYEEQIQALIGVLVDAAEERYPGLPAAAMLVIDKYEKLKAEIEKEKS